MEEALEEEFPDYVDGWNEVEDDAMNNSVVDAIWMFLKIFRWLLNLVFVAIPWGVVAQIFLIWNIWFNIKWNFLWAGGNVFLLINTIY